MDMFVSIQTMCPIARRLSGRTNRWRSIHTVNSVCLQRLMGGRSRTGARRAAWRSAPSASDTKKIAAGKRRLFLVDHPHSGDGKRIEDGTIDEVCRLKSAERFRKDRHAEAGRGEPKHG